MLLGGPKLILCWASPDPPRGGSVGRTRPTLGFELNRVGRSDTSGPKISAALRAAGRSVGRVRPGVQTAKLGTRVGRSDASDPKISAALRAAGRSVGRILSGPTKQRYEHSYAHRSALIAQFVSPIIFFKIIINFNFLIFIKHVSNLL